MADDEVQLRRARITEAALMAASQKVIKTLTVASMNACFPLLADDEPELMKELKTLCETKFNDGIPTAWKEMTDSFKFIENAHELDKVLHHAQKAKESGQPARNMYELGADARVTIPNAAVPVLKEATADLRARREQLQAMNEERLAKVQTAHAEATRTTAQVQRILSDFETAVSTVRRADQSKLEELQDKLVQRVPERGEATV